MADSAGHKVPKIVEKHKYPNMINRTTSESLRLGDTDKILSHPTSLSASAPNPRKKTSFQITSVTVGSHTSNDGGDDSADDLDESHTDDISRVTDFENETPSYSEDTFSKDDVFFNSSTSLGTAPVIPTSSQYGLAIVSTPDGCGNILNSNATCGNNITGNELHVSVADNVINLGLVGGKHLEGDMRDLHSHTGRNERFKVVKIESTEPFKRGRWMCMDYLDHTMSQQQQQQSQTNVNATKVVENNDITVNQFTGTDSGIGMSDNPAAVVHEDQVPVVDQGVSIGATNIMQEHQNLVPPHQQPITSTNSVSPGQTMQSNMQQINTGINQPTQPQVMQQAQSLSAVAPNQQNLVNVNQTQSLPPQQMQQAIVNSNVHNQQQIQQPIQQMPQPVQMQHVHTMPQPAQGTANIQQQFQQPQPTMQQQIPQQAPMQQQQTVLQQQQPSLQQPAMQHIQQPMQHQHGVGMPVQQQSVPVSQPMMQTQPQPQMQQIPQQPQQQIHPQQMQQQGQVQHMQHASMLQHTMPGAATQSCPQMPQQTTQPPQPQTYHQPTSQPMMQPGITHQPPHIPMQTQQQPQYYATTQPMQGASLGAQGPIVASQAVPQTSTLQSQPQQSSSTSLPMQQNYPVTSMPQQPPPQQMSIGHTVAPTSIQHVTTPQIPTQVSVSNIQPPSSQAPVVNPQPTSQGAPLVQQQCYMSQPVVSSGAPTQVVGGSQTFASSAVNVVPSVPVLETTPAFAAAGEVVPNDPAHPAPLLDSLTGEVLSSAEEVQPPAEDAESASGTSAVAIDNKIEQAMDLVKSHLMFAVREEVEVLKEKIAELMDRINQLEFENTILKANATQETLAQLSASTQPPASSAP